MVLDTLEGSRLNIKKLVLTPEQRSISESQRKLDELKKTPLYDHETGYWYVDMTGDQKQSSDTFQSPTQLIAVLVESTIRNTSARERYHILKNSGFFNKQTGYWNFAADKETFGQHLNATAAELLDILCLAQFDKETALEKLSTLKLTELFNAETNQWNNGKYVHMLSVEKRPHSVDQLLGILVEAQFNPVFAQSLYENLKQTNLYDPKIDMWIKSLNWDGEVGSFSGQSESYVQLLDILVVAQLYGKERARERYERLKQTELYDKATGQWNDGINYDNDTEIPIPQRPGDAQLIGILIEHLFEEPINTFQEPIPDIPEQRKF